MTCSGVPRQLLPATHIIFGFSAHSAIKTNNGDCPWCTRTSQVPEILDEDDALRDKGARKAAKEAAAEAAREEREEKKSRGTGTTRTTRRAALEPESANALELRRVTGKPPPMEKAAAKVPVLGQSRRRAPRSRRRWTARAEAGSTCT